MDLRVSYYEQAHLTMKKYAHTLRPQCVRFPEYTWDASRAGIYDYERVHETRPP
jgi:hypothetical protein